MELQNKRLSVHLNFQKMLPSCSISESFSLSCFLSSHFVILLILSTDWISNHHHHRGIYISIRIRYRSSPRRRPTAAGQTARHMTASMTGAQTPSATTASKSAISKTQEGVEIQIWLI